MNLIRPTGMRFQIQVSVTDNWTIDSRVPSSCLLFFSRQNYSKTVVASWNIVNTRWVTKIFSKVVDGGKGFFKTPIEY